MKRYVHFAGNVERPEQMPDGCKWIRVTDFDPLGFLLNTSATKFQTGILDESNFERPSIKLNENELVSIDGYRTFRAPDNNTFKMLTLSGNVEVEAAEKYDLISGEPSARPLAAPFSGFFQASGDQWKFGCPKGTSNLHLRLTDVTGGNLTTLKITPLVMVPPASSPNQKSVWQQGGAWPNNAGSVPDQNRVTPSLPNANYLNLAAIGLATVAVDLVCGSSESDDVVEGVWKRIWSPATGFMIQMTTTPADETVRIDGLFT